LEDSFMQTFSIRDLRARSGDLSHEAEQGHLALVTRHGRPLFVSTPFTEALLQADVHTALAVRLFQEGTLTLGRAARVARMSLAEFQETMSVQGIPVVDCDPADLAEELVYLEPERD
jgi:prevent-host-death family protein